MSNPTPNDRPDDSVGGDPRESTQQPMADPERDVSAPDGASDRRPSTDATDSASTQQPTADPERDVPAPDGASDRQPSTDATDSAPTPGLVAGAPTAEPPAPREARESFTVASAEQDAALGTSSIPVVPAAVAVDPTAATGATPASPAAAGESAVVPDGTAATATAATGTAPSDPAAAGVAPADTRTATIPAPVLAPVAAAAPIAPHPGDVAAPRPATPVFVTAPTPPRARGNRGFGILIAVLAALGFAVLYAAVSWGIFAIAKPSGATAELESYLASIAFWVPVVATFVALVILIVIVNRSGWWAYVIFGLLVGAAVYFAYIGGALLQVQAWTLTYQQASTLIGHLWSNPLTIAAAVVAREVTVWFGAWIAAHGRKVGARNLEAKREYDRMLAAGPEAAAASASGVAAVSGAVYAAAPDAAPASGVAAAPGAAYAAAPDAAPAAATVPAMNPAPEAAPTNPAPEADA